MNDTPIQECAKSLETILRLAWTQGFSIQSNFARENAADVAIAASLGLITTKLKGNTFGTRWLITKQGLGVLNECY